MAAESQTQAVDSRVSLVRQHVTEEAVPDYDPTPSKPEVTRHENGVVDKVTLDRHVDPNGPLAVQIPPEADGTTNSTLHVLTEPTAEEVFAGHASEAEPAAEPEPEPEPEPAPATI